MQYKDGEGLSLEDINEMEERRIAKLDEAGINEQEVLADARENMSLWENYFSENNTVGKDDLNFVKRDQWTAIERSEFTRLFKPAMTFNKLDDIIKKVAAEQRKNKPDLIVRSLTGKATQQQIDLRADLVRTICYQSQTDLVYQAAYRAALMRGYGSFELSLAYETPRSFNQVIVFNLVNDPTMTSFDPCAMKPHKGDGNFSSRRHTMYKEQFFAQYPYINNPTSYNDPRMLLDFQWETRDTIVVADYAVKEWFPLKILKLSNGMSVTEAQWETMQEQFKMIKELAIGAKVLGDVIMNEIPKVVAERQTQDYRIMRYHLVKNQILEFYEWPSQYLPHIFVDGNSEYIDGRQYTKSFIHEARDAQKFINYVGSEIAAEIKNRRREQWIGTPDNIIGNEQMWRNPELQTGILIAKPDPKIGTLPRKEAPWDMSPQLLAQFQRGTMDMREILGFMDENLGQESNAQSGIAIKQRQIAGSMSAYVFQDNMNQAIEQAGRVVLDLLPAVYGEERHVVISKANGITQSIILNQKQDDGTILNRIELGEFDIEIDTGPSFAVQKEVSMQMLMQLLQTPPQSPAFPLLIDLIAKNLDLDHTPQIVERLQTLVPPAILAKEKGEPPPPPQPDPQQQAQQMQMQMAQQQMELKQAELQLKKQKLDLEHAELLLKAKKDQMDSQLDIFNHHADVQRSIITHDLDHRKHVDGHNMEFAKVIADLHKHHNPQKHEGKQYQ